jgi:hypothetical protein
VSDTRTCTGCRSAGQGRALIPTVDEIGCGQICWVCFLTLLTQLRESGDVTVFLARPVAVPQS